MVAQQWACVQPKEKHSGGHGFFIGAFGGSYRPERGWYRDEPIRWVVLLYLIMLRVIRRGTCSHACCRLSRCADCGIWFLTRDWNRHRREPLCPFGCRQKRAAEKSAQRVRIYYQSPEGKQKKRDQNRRRKRRKNGHAPASAIKAVIRKGFPSRILVEHAILITSFIQVELSKEFVCELMTAAWNLWRQLNLEFFCGICETGLRGGKNELWPP